MEGENVINVCTSCIDKKREETQKNFESLLSKMKNSKKDFFVKVNFTTEGKSNENMWLKIHTVNEESKIMVGNLWNEPTIAKHLKHSDEIEVKFEDVIQFLESN